MGKCTLQSVRKYEMNKMLVENTTSVLRRSQFEAQIIVVAVENEQRRTKVLERKEIIGRSVVCEAGKNKGSRQKQNASAASLRRDRVVGRPSANAPYINQPKFSKAPIASQYGGSLQIPILRSTK